MLDDLGLRGVWPVSPAGGGGRSRARNSSTKGFPNTSKVALYRIAQESIQNVVKHSRALVGHGEIHG